MKCSSASLDRFGKTTPHNQPFRLHKYIATRQQRYFQNLHFQESRISFTSHYRSANMYHIAFCMININSFYLYMYSLHFIKTLKEEKTKSSSLSSHARWSNNYNFLFLFIFLTRTSRKTTYYYKITSDLSISLEYCRLECICAHFINNSRFLRRRNYIRH